MVIMNILKLFLIFFGAISLFVIVLILAFSDTFILMLDLIIKNKMIG